MSEIKKLRPITAAELAAKGVVALADRPNQRGPYGGAGLSANDLKKWFDQLSTLIAGKINELQSVLSLPEAADHIALEKAYDEVRTLGDLIRAMESGIFASTIMQAQLPGFIEGNAVIQTIFNEIAAKIGTNNDNISKIFEELQKQITTEKISDGAVTTAKIATSAVTEEKIDSAHLQKVQSAIKSVNYNNKNGVLTFTSVDGSTQRVDLPMEQILDNVYFDEGIPGGDEDDAIVFVFANGDTIRVPTGAILADLMEENFVRSYIGLVNSNKKRIGNTEAAVSPDLATNVADSDVVYRKTVPENVLPYAKIFEVGGMSYKCENLINNTAQSTTMGGVTFTVNGDKSVTITGTASGIVYIPLCEVNVTAGKYTLSGVAAGTDDWGNIYDDNTHAMIVGPLSPINTVDITENKSLRLYIRVYDGKTVNQTVYPMLNKGTTALPYQPYFTGLRDSKVTAIESVGANMFGGIALADKIKEAVTSSVLDTQAKTIEYSAGEVSSKVIFENFEPNTQYTFMFRGKGTAAFPNLAIQYTDGTIESLPWFSTANVINDVRIVSNGSKSIARLIGEWKSGVTTLYYEYCGIFKGNVSAEDFSPYFRETLTIPADALDGYGQGVSKEHCNKIVLDPLEGVKKYVKNCERVILNGTEDWVLNEYATSVGVNIYQIYSSALRKRLGVCSHFTFDSEWSGIDTKKYTAWIESELLLIKTDGVQSLADFKNYLTQQYSAGTPVTLEGALHNPIETDVSTLFTDDNLLPVEAGGTITAVNEYEQAVPTTIEYAIKKELSNSGGDGGISSAEIDDDGNLVITFKDGTTKNLGKVKGEVGPQGPRGEPFTVAKVYSSVAEMNAGYSTDGVAEGAFVVIDTGNVDDEENARLYFKGTSAYVYLTDLSGAQGIKGETGKNAYQYAKEGGYAGTEAKFAEDINPDNIKAAVTPVLGTDYFTDNDQNNIAARVYDLIKNGGVVGFVDENNNIVLSGNLAENIYKIKYEMEDGSTVDIGELKFAYAVVNNLTNCTNSNSAASVVNGGSYSAVISVNNGYNLSSVNVTMGGADITSSAVSGGKINIANVTGDIVITAVAVKFSDPNVLPLAVDLSGNPYNGGQGWKANARLNSSGAESTSSATDIEVTGFIPAKFGDTIRFKNIDWPVHSGTTSVKAYIWVYNSSFAVPAHASGVNCSFREEDDVASLVVVDSNGKLTQFTINENLFKGITNYNDIAYIRVSAYEISDQSIITVNEEIV